MHESGTQVVRWQQIAFALASLGLIALYAPTVHWLFDRWTMDVWHNAHGLLIPPVVAYFVHRELKQLRDLPASQSARGFLIVVPALVLLVLDAAMRTQLLSAASLVLLLPGLALLVIGPPRTRAILFPLMFMALALPIPLGFTEQIHWQLRLLVTAMTAVLAPLFGVPVHIEGTTLNFSGGSLEVADACSGFSVLYAAIAVACLVAYSVESKSRAIAVLICAAPLAIAANILRVLLLVLLVQWKGIGILQTFIHPLSGMITFVLVIPILVWLGERPVHREAD